MSPSRSDPWIKLDRVVGMLLGLLSLERKLVSRLGLPEYHPEPQGLRQARVSHTKPPGIVQRLSGAQVGISHVTPQVERYHPSV